MESLVLLELFGYMGSVLVVCSMLMSSVVKLRLINMIGSIISGIYALLCGALPLFAMNTALIIINGYNLFKLFKTEKRYEMIVCDVADSSLKYFLELYHDDIHIYFPEFKRKPSEINTAYMIYCEGTPVGLLLGENKGNGVLDVQLDYSIPSYRDGSVGEYVYSKLSLFGIHEMIYTIELSQKHKDYLRKMGFVQNGEIYSKNWKNSEDM